jgi:hypothetical protein
MKTETRYKKVGRKYVPVAVDWNEYGGLIDSMNVGEFRLKYAYENGAGYYEYKVEPATAPFVAAAMIARLAMVDKIISFSKMRPSGSTKYTKSQIAAIAEFREKMGGMFPSWWTENSAYEIADAAIDAVKNYKP